MQRLARRRGGQCLSGEYLKGDSKLTWKCKEGHQWDARPNLIKRGRWCPHCSKLKQSGSIEEMQEVARERGGKCLSHKYTNSTTKLSWQCRQGHIWDGTPAQIKQGHWCPVCGGSQKGSIEEMRQIASSRGGACLSEGYINNSTKLTWQCNKGHQWEAAPLNIKLGKWCPVCSGTQLGTIEEMRQIAESRGGRCLSAKYTNSRTKLAWQCKNGHRWMALPSSIKQGHWCSRCPGMRG
jgi:hypothetical protein